MGFAVAQAARNAGAEVVLISGPVSIATPPGVRRVDCESAVDMFDAVTKEVGKADVFISTAAVADYKPAKPADQKIKKASDRMDLEMERTTDILATVAASPDRPPLVVGFAAETENVEQNARGKLLKKNLDMIAANEVGDAKVFECEDNHLIVLSRTGRHDLGQASKTALAERLIELIAAALAERTNNPQRGGASATA
jgi:phosphopantothenoylcysteine decarboxylase/phosphopantothenate--cysteine ligase